MTKRRAFIKKSLAGTAGIAIGGIGFSSKSYASIIGYNPKEKMTSVVDMSGDWLFAYTKIHTGNVPDASLFKTSMPVPGCWDDHLNASQAKVLWQDVQFNPSHEVKFPLDEGPDASLPYLRGTGWYLKRMNVPADWREGTVSMSVGRVVTEAWVYINGHEIHNHFGHSTSWQVNLAPHLKFGEVNEIVIAVDNNRKDRIGTILRGWKGQSSGIFGPVSLKIAGATRIADAYFFVNNDKLQWNIELDGKQINGMYLLWKIYEPQTNRLLGKGRQSVDGNKLQWTTGTLGMRPWSDIDPVLNRIELSLWDGENCIDTVIQAFGMRQLKRHGTGLNLNGNPVYLRGLCETAYFPKTCTPSVEADWYRLHILKLKQLGFNWMRFHTWVPTELYMQAADELGMLIQVEPPVDFELAEWCDILRSCRAHPSVVIYCCGNEEVLDERKIDYLRQCANELRIIVPDALFNPQEALRGVETGNPLSLFGDGIVLEPYPHNPQRLEKLKVFTDVFASYSNGFLSYNSINGDHRNIDERLVPYERPSLTHELGIIGSYLNLDLEGRYEGTRIGPVLYEKAREALVIADLVGRAGIYYRNSCAWQRLIRKDVVEMARKCRLIKGYDMLGAVDYHWHRYGYECGIMNEFDEMKHGESVTDVLRYNGESVLLISDQRTRNLKAGLEFTREIEVSWFGRGALRNGTLEWQFRDVSGEMLGSGKQTVALVATGTVEKIADIRLAIPKSQKPGKATLAVQLTGAECVIENQWDFWIFPTPINTGESDNVKVVSSIDDEVLKNLLSGGRVVLLGYKPFASRATSFQIGRAGRAQENLATVISDHPLMRRFPHDGFCDWQFFRMLGNAVAVQFNGIDDAFDPIIEVVSSYKNIIKQAAIFEWRVGKGALLVSTLKLPESDPSAAYFKSCLLEYAASTEFQPRTKVQPDLLSNLMLPGPFVPLKQFKTDEGFDPNVKMPKD